MSVISLSGEPEKLIAYRRVVDLSHPIAPEIPIWPGDPAVAFHDVAQPNSHGYFLREFSMGEHSGTHLVSPSTYHADGAGPDALQPESLVVGAVVIDISNRASENSNYTLSASDVAEWERTNGQVPSSAVVVMNTGWSRLWRQPDRFINADAGGAMHTPGFTIEAARLLLEWRHISGLGIDTHGIDPGMDAELSVSRLALAQSALVLECLNNLDHLPPIGVTLIVGRLPLVGGSGSPASVLALVP